MKLTFDTESAEDTDRLAKALGELTLHRGTRDHDWRNDAAELLSVLKRQGQRDACLKRQSPLKAKPERRNTIVHGAAQRRHYIHGDLDDSGRAIFCGRCGGFQAVSHFDEALCPHATGSSPNMDDFNLTKNAETYLGTPEGKQWLRGQRLQRPIGAKNRFGAAAFRMFMRKAGVVQGITEGLKVLFG